MPSNVIFLNILRHKKGISGTVLTWNVFLFKLKIEIIFFESKFRFDSEPSLLEFDDDNTFFLI